jgi:hypothetical protein
MMRGLSRRGTDAKTHSNGFPMVEPTIPLAEPGKPPSADAPVAAPALASVLPAGPSDSGRSGWWKSLGPGLVTGAADDDPSGIGTYSQVGAKFGYSLAWTMVFGMSPRIMGRFTLPRGLLIGGWIATAVMGVVALGFFAL